MGSVVSMYAANWPPKAKWSVDDIPDLSGKVIIVTGVSETFLNAISTLCANSPSLGGNSGIGDETVKALLTK